MPPQNPAKMCPFCSTAFSLSDLVLDVDVEPIGMMLQDDAADCMYFFNHECPGCGTTFAVPIDVFAAMIDEPIPPHTLGNTAACNGHCSRLKDLAICDNECANAPYRRFLVNVLHRDRPVAQRSLRVTRKP